jgi:hypothetical protein
VILWAFVIAAFVFSAFSTIWFATSFARDADDYKRLDELEKFRKATEQWTESFRAFVDAKVAGIERSLNSKASRLEVSTRRSGDEERLVLELRRLLEDFPRHVHAVDVGEGKWVTTQEPPPPFPTEPYRGLDT